jgi:hypothetical protein
VGNKKMTKNIACKYYQTEKRCSFGKNCRYLHEEIDLTPIPIKEYKQVSSLKYEKRQFVSIKLKISQYSTKKNIFIVGDETGRINLVIKKKNFEFDKYINKTLYFKKLEFEVVPQIQLIYNEESKHEELEEDICVLCSVGIKLSKEVDGEIKELKILENEEILKLENGIHYCNKNNIELIDINLIKKMMNFNEFTEKDFENFIKNVENNKIKDGKLLLKVKEIKNEFNNIINEKTFNIKNKTNYLNEELQFNQKMNKFETEFECSKRMLIENIQYNNDDEGNEFLENMRDDNFFVIQKIDHFNNVIGIIKVFNCVLGDEYDIKKFSSKNSLIEIIWENENIKNEIENVKNEIENKNEEDLLLDLKKLEIKESFEKNEESIKESVEEIIEETIEETQSTFNCECGSIIKNTKNSKDQHFKTKKHLNYFK